MADTLIEVADRYVGKRETLGNNDGPEIRIWKALLGPGVVAAAGIPWCAIFVTAMLMVRNAMNRKRLIAALGFRPMLTYFESCDSWVTELLLVDESLRRDGRPGIIVSEPQPGDLVFLMERTADGSYSKTKAHHVLIATSSVHNGIYSSIEGNTVPGTAEGAASRNGDGVYRRHRVFSPGRQLVARLPSKLTGF